MPPSDLDHLSRYRSLVDDWPAFCATATRPLPTCVWTNTLRATPALVQALLAAEGVDAEPLAWLPGAFRLAPDVGPGSRLPYHAGLYHVQEEVSLLPAVLLDPQPGERVLDMCAAPGGKTAQIAVAMRNRGTVVANDRSFMRARALSGTLSRLGVLNACTTTYDAANLPAEAGAFDRILADVPCSCEGTSRKHPGALATMGPGASEKFTGMQGAILRKAVRLCRPGGRIVYSTCTYAPEENELVVDAILREFGDGELALVPADVPGIVSSEGLTSWRGRRLHESLRRTLRVWPHQNDTGGFFVAVLEKDAASPDRPDEVVPSIEPHPEADAWRDRVGDHFGFPESVLAGSTLAQFSRKYLSVVARGLRPPPRPEPDTFGMPFMRVQWRYPKLTTAAAMAFGGAATQNVVDVNQDEADDYLSRRDFAVARARTAACTGPGYVLVRHASVVLGVGLLRLEDDAGVVHSMYPKAWARQPGTTST